MRAALRGVLTIDKRIILLTVLVGMGDHALYHVTLQMYGFIQRVVGHILLHQVAQTVARTEFATVVNERQPGVKKRIVLHHHHPVGLGSQSRHDGAQVAVVHVEHPLPQHFAQREALVAMLVDVVVKQSRYHVVSRGDGMEVTCKVQVDLVHRQHLGMATA